VLGRGRFKCIRCI